MPTKYIQDKEGQANNGLAKAAGGAARVGRVVGGLGRKSRDPYHGEDNIDDDHDIGLGQLAGAREARRPDEIDPGGYGKETLRKRSVSLQIVSR